MTIEWLQNDKIYKFSCLLFSMPNAHSKQAKARAISKDGFHLDDIILTGIYKLIPNHNNITDKAEFTEITDYFGVVKYAVPWGEWLVKFDSPTMNIRLLESKTSVTDLKLRFQPYYHSYPESEFGIPGSIAMDLAEHNYSSDIFKDIVKEIFANVRDFLKNIYANDLLNTKEMKDSVFVVVTDMSRKNAKQAEESFGVALRKGELIPRMLYEFNPKPFLDLKKNPSYSIASEDKKLISSNRKTLEKYLSGTIVDLGSGDGLKLAGYKNVIPLDISLHMNYIALHNMQQYFGIHKDLENHDPTLSGLLGGNTCLLLSVPLITDEKKMLEPYLTKDEKIFEQKILEYAGLDPEKLDWNVNYNSQLEQIEFSMTAKEDIADKYGNIHLAGKRIIVDRAKRYTKNSIKTALNEYGLYTYKFMTNAQESQALMIAAAPNVDKFDNAVSLLGGTMANFPDQSRLFGWLSSLCTDTKSIKSFRPQYHHRREFIEWLNREFRVGDTPDDELIARNEGQITRAASYTLLTTKCFSDNITNNYYRNDLQDLISSYALGDHGGFLRSIKDIHFGMDWE